MAHAVPNQGQPFKHQKHADKCTGGRHQTAGQEAALEAYGEEALEVDAHAINTAAVQNDGNAQMVIDGRGVRMWELAFSLEVEGVRCDGAVFVNAQTGMVEAVEYTAAG